MAKTLTIDGKEYALDDLSDSAKSQAAHVQMTDQEIAALQQRLAIAQTARQAYAKALQAELTNTD
jgi:hypothetical protein